jgi:hypothetical protein
MARYEHLHDPSAGSGQVYKKAMDLTIYFEKIVRNFSLKKAKALLEELS